MASTATVKARDGIKDDWVPSPTAPQDHLSPREVLLNARAITTLSANTETCGYINGHADQPLICALGATCASWTVNGQFGCCRSGQASSDCFATTACVASTSGLNFFTVAHGTSACDEPGSTICGTITSSNFQWWTCVPTPIAAGATAYSTGTANVSVAQTTSRSLSSMGSVSGSNSGSGSSSGSGFGSSIGSTSGTDTGSGSGSGSGSLNGSSLPTGAIVGIVVGAVVALVLLSWFGAYRRKVKARKEQEKLNNANRDLWGHQNPGGRPQQPLYPDRGTPLTRAGLSAMDSRQRMVNEEMHRELNYPDALGYPRNMSEAHTPDGRGSQWPGARVSRRDVGEYRRQEWERYSPPRSPVPSRPMTPPRSPSVAPPPYERYPVNHEEDVMSDGGQTASVAPNWGHRPPSHL